MCSTNGLLPSSSREAAAAAHGAKADWLSQHSQYACKTPGPAHKSSNSSSLWEKLIQLPRAAHLAPGESLTIIKGEVGGPVEIDVNVRSPKNHLHHQAALISVVLNFHHGVRMHQCSRITIHIKLFNIALQRSISMEQGISLMALPCALRSAAHDAEICCNVSRVLRAMSPRQASGMWTAMPHN